MFKLIFRMMVITVFLIFLTFALALWKGGEPFRVFGEGVIIAGRAFIGFGDMVDEFIGSGKRLHKSYDEIKDVLQKEEGRTGGRD